MIPAVLYAIKVWGSCSDSLFKELEKVHQTAAEIIYKLPRGMPKDQILKEVKWDSITFMYQKRIALMMHKVYSNVMIPSVAK